MTTTSSDGASGSGPGGGSGTGPSRLLFAVLAGLERVTARLRRNQPNGDPMPMPLPPPPPGPKSLVAPAKTYAAIGTRGVTVGPAGESGPAR